MLNFDEFQEYVKENIRDFLPDELKNANVDLNTVQKNNGKVLHAILVKPQECNISPSVYLEGFFKSYEDGADLSTVMKDVADTSARNQEPGEFKDFASNYVKFDFVKDKIIMAVVNAKKNAEMLKDTPHVMKEDLACIYKVMVGNEAQGMATVTVKTPHMETWGIDVEQLHELAMKNTNELLPASCRSMNDVMMDMFGGQDDLFEMMVEDIPQEKQMYVISNSQSINGAAAMFYGDTLSKLSEDLGTDLFILPSSVHEIIAVSTEIGDPEELAMMVQEVNAGQVSEDEQLSDHVYRFDAKSQTISLADTTVEELKADMVSDQQQQYNVQNEEVARPRHGR